MKPAGEFAAQYTAVGAAAFAGDDESDALAVRGHRREEALDRAMSLVARKPVQVEAAINGDLATPQASLVAARKLLAPPGR